MGVTNAFGHGLGYEIMPPEMLGSKLVSLEISSDTWPDKIHKRNNILRYLKQILVLQSRMLHISLC